MPTLARKAEFHVGSSCGAKQSASSRAAKGVLSPEQARAHSDDLLRAQSSWMQIAQLHLDGWQKLSRHEKDKWALSAPMNADGSMISTEAITQMRMWQYRYLHAHRAYRKLHDDLNTARHTYKYVNSKSAKKTFVLRKNNAHFKLQQRKAGLMHVAGKPKATTPPPQVPQQTRATADEPKNKHDDSETSSDERPVQLMRSFIINGGVKKHHDRVPISSVYAESSAFVSHGQNAGAGDAEGATHRGYEAYDSSVTGSYVVDTHDKYNYGACSPLGRLASVDDYNLDLALKAPDEGATQNEIIDQHVLLQALDAASCGLLSTAPTCIPPLLACEPTSYVPESINDGANETPDVTRPAGDAAGKVCSDSFDNSTEESKRVPDEVIHKVLDVARNAREALLGKHNSLIGTPERRDYYTKYCAYCDEILRLINAPASMQAADFARNLEIEWLTTVDASCEPQFNMFSNYVPSGVCYALPEHTIAMDTRASEMLRQQVMWFQ